jgi:hypothetical protein
MLDPYWAEVARQVERLENIRWAHIARIAEKERVNKERMRGVWAAMKERRDRHKRTLKRAARRASRKKSA